MENFRKNYIVRDHKTGEQQDYILKQAAIIHFEQLEEAELLERTYHGEHSFSTKTIKEKGRDIK